MNTILSRIALGLIGYAVVITFLTTVFSMLMALGREEPLPDLVDQMESGTRSPEEDFPPATDQILQSGDTG